MSKLQIDNLKAFLLNKNNFGFSYTF